MHARFLPIAAAFLLAAPLAAQSTTSGAVRGTVTDEGGNPLPGTTITATNQETGFTRPASTDETGAYVLRLLPPGTYRVTGRRIGQQPVEQSNIAVIVGSTVTVNFQMRVAVTQLATERILAETPIDVSDAGVRQTVTEAEIDNLPSRGRDFTDFIETSGMVSPNPEATTGGQFSIGGARPSQTNIQIDGVDANNSFFGENRGGSRIPFSFSLESIREFQIITNGYDVEYGRYTGGTVNIVTKGGTNTFRGSVYGNLRNDTFTAENFDGTQPNDYSVYQFALQAEGPVIKDKLHWFASADAQRRREPFTSISIERLANSEDFADTTVFRRYLTALDTAYGISDPESMYGRWLISNDVFTLFGRLDWTISDAHRLSVRNNYANHRNHDEAGSFAINTGRSQAEKFEDRSNSLVAELTSVLRPNMFNVARVLYATEERPRLGNEPRPELNVRLTPGLTVEYGGAFISYRNNLIENKIQLIDNITMEQGSHTFKLGTNNTFTHIENTFWLNGSGQFQFSSIDDFEARRPSRFTRNLRADGSLPEATFDVQEYSVYAQDEWQVTPRLLAVLGLRYDIARYGDRPRRVVDVERAFGFTTGIAPVDNNNISPRVSLTWDRNGDASEVIRLGGGLFYGTVPFVMGGNVAGADVPMRTLTCEGSIDDLDPDAPPVVDYPSFGDEGQSIPTSCRGQTGFGGVPEYAFWSQDFSIPETFKVNAGYERMLTPRTKAGLDLIFTASQKLYSVRNLNLRNPLFQLENEGGRLIFVPEGQYDPSSTAGAARLQNTDFANIYVNHNDGVARSVSASANFDHRVSDRVLFRFLENTLLKASYTYTWAKDNSSFSCCTSNEGFTGQRYGALGPNVIGGVGNRNAGWGPSNFERRHTILFSGFATLPGEIRMTGVMRFASGVPFSPEVSGDLNNDGVSFNDRPYIFAPEDLPVYVGSATGTAATAIVAEHRTRYAEYLEENKCVGDFVGRIIPRNTCRQPWFNKLDLGFRRKFEMGGEKSAELSLDLFNVLNFIDKDLGTYRSVQSFNRNILSANRYNGDTGEVEYTVPTRGTQEFGITRTLGTNLLLQASAQLGVRVSF